MAPLAAALRAVPTWLALVALTLVGGVLPVLIADRYGALGIPRNDDWSYLLATFRLGESGRFDLNGWATVNVVGQIVPGVPLVWIFGRRVTPLQLEIVVFGLVGLLALFQLGCMLVSRARALYAALLVALFPLWAPLAVSFMTDVPAFALEMVAVAFGVRALRPAARGGDRIDTVAYAASLASAFFGYTIRDNVIVPFVALTMVGAWCAWRGTRRDRFVVGAGVVGWLVATALFMLWKHGATGYQNPNFTLHGDVVSSALRRSLQLLPLTGIALAPVLVLAGPVRLVRASVRRAPRLALLSAVAVGGLVGALTAARGRPLGTGNYVEPYGTLGRYVLPGWREQLLPDGLLAVLGTVGVLSITVIAVGFVRPLVDQCVAVRARRFGPPSDPGPALVALAVFGFLLFIVASGVAGNALWDRYLLPVVPLLALLLLRASPTPAPAPAPTAVRRTGAVLALGALGAFGLVFSVNSASFDGARWTVAAEAARAVGGTEHVNGGFEWVDYHAGREVYLRDPVSDRFCVQLEGRAGRPRATDRTVVASAGVWGPAGNQTWIVARRTGACTG